MVKFTEDALFSIEHKTQILGIDFKVLTKTYLLDSWILQIKRLSKNRLGQCNYIKKSIELNLDYLEVNSLQRFQNTLMHEVAHAMVYEKYRFDNKWKSIKPHGKEWKEAAITIGAQPVRCPEFDGIKPKFNYWLECKVHGVIESWIRRPFWIYLNNRMSKSVRRLLCPVCKEAGYKNYLQFLHLKNSVNRHI
ncbi:MAG TPA: SprT-like domain-containing protein [Thermodesulfobacteriota bacterium]|nr:SprT-like domain-containing protein [Thermodesulfobacteriota bacterium]